jgi:c-di-GMP-binding flagellar brake protein YcgR
MPLPSKLAVGQRLELQWATEWLPTRLEDVAEPRLEVAWPTDRERRLVPLKVGDTVLLATSAEDALYSVATQVESARQDGLPLLKLRITGEWQRSQRRNAVRVAVAIRPRVADKIEGEKRTKLRAGVSNLSANGIQVRSQDELKPGDVIDIAFSVMDVDEEIEAQAIVRRVQQHERGTLHVWEAGCELQGLSPRLQQKLVQFIFAQQRAQMRHRKAG